ncbi:MAG TPA: hypothetical protein VI937_01730 [Negativicutes bacterium]|nr:hypothetical protein [Negativicutes bacterium]
MLTSRLFEILDIEASVFLNGTSKYLEVDRHGLIAIPKDVQPEAFKLSLLVPQNGRMFVAQKDVAQDQGAYMKGTMRSTGSNGDYAKFTMQNQIAVRREGRNVWTNWHGPDGATTNRVDCFQLTAKGMMMLFQIGVITHDDGRTWRLHGETRWHGQLFYANGQLVGKPEKPEYGPIIETWKKIFGHPKFKNLLAESRLPQWEGSQLELEMPLQKAPQPGLAVMQWYISFAGQSGQGYANLNDGTVASVHGADILESPEGDGVKRLRRNDLVAYKGTAKFGSKQSTKLLKVYKV